VSMPIHGVLGLIALSFCATALPAEGPVLEQRGDGPYTIFVELHPPYPGNRARLQKMLKSEGLESFVEREQELALTLTQTQIKRLFGAQVRFREVAASASDRFVRAPYLDAVKIPARFAKLIIRVYMDPQRD
jgi:hypothetical protein